MLIALNDPIWARLYGPYGVQDVAGTLQALDVRWDEALAQDLFWERLHHQDTLYPVTYAALPWLWHLAPRAPEGSHTFPFLSHVLACAYSADDRADEGAEERTGWPGLSLVAEDHHMKWLDPVAWLRAEDMAVLEQLGAWFKATTPAIAEACLRAVAGKSGYFDAHLLSGPAVLRGAPALAMACEMWGAEERMDQILDEAAPQREAERAAAVALAGAVGPRNPALTGFLRAWAAS